jgi:predicted Zn-dependent protease
MGFSLGISKMTPQEAYLFAQPGFKAYSEARFADAETIANKILALLPDDPNGLYLKGICRRASKDPKNALAYVKRAAEIAPGQMGFDIAICQILADLEHYDEAIENLTALVSRYPQSDMPLLRLGEVYRHIRQTDKARTQLDAALKIRADNPETHLEMARTHEIDRSAPDMARAADKALQLMPNWLDATLIRARADMMTGQAELAVTRLSALATPSPDRVCELTCLLGDAHDAAGNSEAALASWTRGNSAAHDHYKTVYNNGRSAYDLAGAQRAKRVTDRLAPQTESADNLNDLKHPVFLVGFPRSGTTLIEQVLAAHPSINTSDERDCIGPIIQRVTENDASLEGFFGLDQSELDVLRDEYWRRVGSAGLELDRPVFVDKSPLNIVWLGVIGRLFPDARVIVALRDPRAVTFASFKRNFSMNAAMYNMLTLPDAAQYYDAVFKAFDAGASAFPKLQIHTIKYEDLVGQFDPAIRQLIADLGLPWNDAVLEYREKLDSRTISTPSSDQVARPIFTDSLNQWHSYRAALEPVRKWLDPWAERWGYAKA